MILMILQQQPLLYDNDTLNLLLSTEYDISQQQQQQQSKQNKKSREDYSDNNNNDFMYQR